MSPNGEYALEDYAVETEDLVRRFGDFTAVDRINLRVARGSFFGFLGPNGAGKSTTIKMLTGLLARMPGGLMLLPNRESAAPEPAASFYSEVFDGHIGYLRLGPLNSANLKEMDKNLQDFVAKKVDAVIVDLRASSVGDFATAAEFAKRFCPKGKALFTVRKPAARQDRSFSSDRDPAFQGLIVALIDSDTAGGLFCFPR